MKKVTSRDVRSGVSHYYGLRGYQVSKQINPLVDINVQFCGPNPFAGPEIIVFDRIIKSIFIDT